MMAEIPAIRVFFSQIRVDRTSLPPPSSSYAPDSTTVSQSLLITIWKLFNISL